MSFSSSSSSSSAGKEKEQQKPNWTQKENSESKEQERIVTVEVPEDLFFQIKYLPSSSASAVKSVFETLQNWFRQLELIPDIQVDSEGEEEEEKENSDSIDLAETQ